MNPSTIMTMKRTKRQTRPTMYCGNTTTARQLLCRGDSVLLLCVPAVTALRSRTSQRRPPSRTRCQGTPQPVSTSLRRTVHRPPQTSVSRRRKRRTRSIERKEPAQRSRVQSSVRPRQNARRCAYHKPDVHNLQKSLDNFPKAKQLPRCICAKEQ